LPAQTGQEFIAANKVCGCPIVAVRFDNRVVIWHVPAAMADNQIYDVLIAGGGLAGQCLARQLRLARPELSVAVIDFEKRPLPEAAFKVGEATSELGAHYFAVKLQLKDYLNREHLLKNGLRFFFGDAQGPLQDRPEYGPRQFPPVSSFQLDRGKLENHLRDLNQAAGITLLEGFGVQEISLGDNDAPHTTVILECNGSKKISLRSIWVVDCTGRQRILQKKLNLCLPSPLKHSASWFRVKGKCNVENFVPADNVAWHEQVPGGIRHRSTNHLVGHGYWVWLIPLSSDNTSIGIVVDERIHPIANMNTYEKALAWLKIHEPVVAQNLGGVSVMDFLFFKEFSYETKQFYSAGRWACVGEAAAFLDPFYSPGSDFIAMGNTMVTQLIRRHFEKTFTSAAVEQSNATMLLLHRAFTDVFRDQYPTFGRAKVMTAKVVWDNASYWVFICQVFFQDIFFEDKHLDRYCRLLDQFYRLNLRVQQLFRDWTARSRDGSGYDYLGYEDFPVAVRSHLELDRKKGPRRFLEWLELNLDRFSAWGIVLFLIAVEDAAPEWRAQIAEENLTTELIDLNDLEAAAASRALTHTGRNPLATEITSLKRQMTKLFPHYDCLRETSDRRQPADETGLVFNPIRTLRP
jgi:flavin-dependent dehydrogenase